MDDAELAELEMHLAAGTDLPTSLAALLADPPDESDGSTAFHWGIALGVVLIGLWWLLG
ncbi:MAG TPA: hypothetical protein VHZ24_12620 [Pirellulales bacterium]|jgi:hypothetical protein|nr:hypothetical protein [Pirellulales bacterium]